MWDGIESILNNFVINFIVDMFKPLFDLSTLNTLVFGEDKELVWKTFTPEEWENQVVAGVDITIQIAYWAILFGIIFMAILINKSAFNPQSRTSLLEMVGALLLVAFLIRNIDSLYQFFFSINNTLVGVFQQAISDQELSISQMHDGGIGFILIWGAYLGLSLWANIYYLMRKFTLIIFMILGPVFIALFIFPPFRSITLNWMRELFSTIMIQAIHATILWSFLQVDSEVTDNWLVKLVMLACFIPIGEGLKALFGLNPALTNKMAIMTMATGTAGMASLFSAMQTAVGKRSFLDGLEARYAGGKPSTPRVGEGATSNQDGNIAQSLPQMPVSARTQRMLNVGNHTSRAGKAALTVVGAAAGMPLGPGGVLAGAIIGGKIGNAAGGFSGRATAALVDSGNAAKSQLTESINKELDSLDKNYAITPVHESGRTEGHTDYQKKILGNLGAKTHAVAKGTIKGISQLGKVGKGSYQSLADQKRAKTDNFGYLGGVILGESGIQLGQKAALKAYPELQRDVTNSGMEYSDFVTQYDKHDIKDVRLAVTREHSSILGKVRNSDGTYSERRLTDYRGGDSSLKDGEVVYRDYHVQHGRIVDGSSPIQQNRDIYTEDSKGGKKRVNKNYQINPYDYFEDRNNGSEQYFRPDRFKQGIV